LKKGGQHAPDFSSTDKVKGVNMLRICTQPTRQLKGGQYAPDFFTSFFNFRGVSICRTVMKNDHEKPKNNLIFYRTPGVSIVRYIQLHINPVAAGIQGFHQVPTLIRFTIDMAVIKDLEVIELGQKGIIPI
jgi:hypothetical protein